MNVDRSLNRKQEDEEKDGRKKHRRLGVRGRELENKWNRENRS
jgi:hypothetical protein